MKKIVLATVLAALGSASALAADLGPRAYTKAPMMAAPISTWQGFYIGGNVGYGFGDSKTDFAFFGPVSVFNLAAPTLKTDLRGVIGGAQIGYNWQIGSFVAGIEADFQGSGIKGDASGPVMNLNSTPPVTVPGFLTNSSEKLSWFGTVRGRFGVTATPDLLLYATGGLAYGEVKTSTDAGGSPFPDFPVGFSKTKTGWTAGAGAEWMFARNWSAKVEYLFLDLGKDSALGVSPLPLFSLLSVGYHWRTQENIVRAGVNYHF
jgi:outer membrane immunogenic protein